MYPYTNNKLHIDKCDYIQADVRRHIYGEKGDRKVIHQSR